MMQLNACSNWAIERNLVALDKSPFEGFTEKVRKAFKKAKPPINAFTAAERDAIIQAFQESHFYNYVRFCFFTGCRPSEAIGLEWDDIAPDFSWIRFHQAVVLGIRGEGLKTQESRIFPCNEQLKDILTNTRQQAKPQSKSVFMNKSGKTISIPATPLDCCVPALADRLPETILHESHLYYAMPRSRSGCQRRSETGLKPFKMAGNELSTVKLAV